MGVGVRLGSARIAGEGTRIGTVRRAHHGAFSVGCYCENEARCHRSILRQLLLDKGASMI
ncbi:MAG: hypothetical protein K0B16_04540 [Burkholderiaceae bacterium]|nr:hypothetical protein [Burkholderiaceae bacterium]